MDKENLTAYLVEIKEVYVENVVVYANSPEEAKEIAAELCAEVAIEVNFPSCLEDRNVTCERRATKFELEARKYPEYDRGDITEEY